MGARLSYANVVATVALFVALGGGAYAAIDLVGRNDIKSKHIAKNAATGKDIAESSLGQVPEAANAVSAANAATAASAADADKVNGLEVMKIDYRRDNPSPKQTILDLAGLRLEAECVAGGTRVYATTSKQNSSLYGFGESPPFDGNSSDSFDYEGGEFDPGVTADLDALLDYLGSPRIGSLVYEAPDGAVVTLDFASDNNGTSDCLFSGTAIGG